MARKRASSLVDLVRDLAEDMLVDVIARAMRDVRTRAGRAIARPKAARKRLREVTSERAVVDYELHRIAELKRRVDRN